MDLLHLVKMYFWIIISILTEIFKNAFGMRKRFEGKRRMEGKVVVITGANTGIGKQTALQLSIRGAKIIIGCRDLEKAETAVQDIRTSNQNADICVLRLDLSSLTSVRQFAKSVAEQESKIDILINSAGIMMCPEWTTEDGFEMQFGTNHLGHFLLTLSLIKLLKKSPKARIITVSSIAHLLGKIHFSNINLRNGVYSPVQAYSQSKLANILFTNELNRKLNRINNINTYSLHPGIINSDLGRHLPFENVFMILIKFFSISVELGTQTTLFCALEESLDSESGFYYDNCKRVENMTDKAIDRKSAEKLWELSSDLVKLENALKIK